MPTAFLMLLQAWVNIEQNFSANIIAFSFMCLLWGGKNPEFCVIVLVSVRVLEMESNFVAQAGLRLLCSSSLLCICTVETTGTWRCAWLTHLKSIYLFLILCVCLWTMCLLNVQGPGEGVRSPRIGVTDGCEPPCPLEAQPMLLTAEPSL